MRRFPLIAGKSRVLCVVSVEESIKFLIRVRVDNSRIIPGQFEDNSRADFNKILKLSWDSTKLSGTRSLCQNHLIPNDRQVLEKLNFHILNNDIKSNNSHA